MISQFKQKFYEIYFRIKGVQLGSKTRINHFCHLTKKTIIGDNCHFNGLKVAGNGYVKIGDNFHSGEEILIITQNHNYDFGNRIPYDDTYIIKDVLIGKNVWIGTRVTILPGTVIEDGAIIQAGSVVHGTIPRCSICGGNPAVIIKYRNIEHYEKLEREKKYW